jgi:hypothetical protein
MQKKHENMLKLSIVIIAITLMSCSFGCKSNKSETADAKPIEKVNQEATKTGDSINTTVKEKPVKEKAGKVAGKANNDMTKSTSAINKNIEKGVTSVAEKINKKASEKDGPIVNTVEKASAKIEEAATKVGGSMNNAIETTSEKVSGKVSEEENK